MRKLLYVLTVFLLVGTSVMAGLDWGPFSDSDILSSGGNNASAVSAGTESATGEYPVVDEEIGAELSSSELVDEVGAAVVSIVTETISYNWRWQAVPETGAGTGIIISSDGWIVTNNHVVEDADTVTVTLSDGSAYEATGITTDPETDLAVVKIDASGLPCLHFLSNSLEQLDELEPVVAVGNALALEGGPTWTTGVISNLGRTIEFSDGTVLYDVIQTDAAINPGNSGGPLINTAGQVVGINVAMADDAENIGFAISTDTAIPVIWNLIEEGQVVRPYLGVSMVEVTSTIKYQYGLSVDEGVMIYGVVDDSPAEDAGLEAMDVVTVIDGQEVTTIEEVRVAIQSHQVGDEIEIVYYRGDQQETTQATLIEMPS